MIPLLLALAAFHVPVSCAPTLPGPRPDAEGAYLPAEETIVLQTKTCDGLQAAREGLANVWTARAVHVLGHELAHSYGIMSETGADCVGGTFSVWAGRKIGIPYGVLEQDWRLDEVREPACRAWFSDGAPH